MSVRRLLNWLPSLLLSALLVGGAALSSDGPNLMRRNVVSRSGDTMTGQLVMGTGSTLAIDATGTGAGFRSAAGSGTNAFGATTNGARIDFGAGASDHASSNGTTVTFAGALATSSTFDATSNIVGQADFQSSGTGYFYWTGVTVNTGRFTSNISAANMAATAAGAAFKFFPQSAPDANDWIFSVGNEDNVASVFSVDLEGDLLASGDLSLAGGDLSSTITSQTFNITSATADTTTSATVAAITLAPTVDITAGDLVLEVNNSAGASLFTIDEEGDVVQAGGATFGNLVGITTTGSTAQITSSGTNQFRIVSNITAAVALPSNPAFRLDVNAALDADDGAFSIFAASTLFYVDYEGDVDLTGSLTLVNLTDSPTAPTVAACTAPTVTWHNGSAALNFDVGTACGTGTATITFPTTLNCWTCHCFNVTTDRQIVQTSCSGTVASMVQYTVGGAAQNFVDGDDIQCLCRGG